MTRKPDRIKIEVFGPTEVAKTAGEAFRPSNDAIRSVARLLGRQMPATSRACSRLGTETGPGRTDPVLRNSLPFLAAFPPVENFLAGLLWIFLMTILVSQYKI